MIYNRTTISQKTQAINTVRRSEKSVFGEKQIRAVTSGKTAQTVTRKELKSKHNIIM